MTLPPSGHDPVLLAEVLEILALRPGQTVVDCTLGRGGHALEIAKRLGPGGTLVGLDVDPRNLEYARERLTPSPLQGEGRGEGRSVGSTEVPGFGNTSPPDAPTLLPSPGVRGGEAAGTPPSPSKGEGLTIRLFHANFAELPEVLKEIGQPRVYAILADLGLSTNQLFDPHYGLSFGVDANLDMRIDPRIPRSAADLVNTTREEDLANLLFNLADERYSRRIARKIVEARRVSPITSTERLADLVRQAIPTRGGAPEKIDPATRTFLALRMAVNQELDNLKTLLRIAPQSLEPGGVLAVISFQSTEDRIVKQAFRSAEQTGQVEILTKKPVVPRDTEIQANPRSRSAKLRAVRRKSL